MNEAARTARGPGRAEGLPRDFVTHLRAAGDLKMYALLSSGMFHFLFADHGVSRVSETAESEAVNEAETSCSYQDGRRPTGASGPKDMRREDFSPTLGQPRTRTGAAR